MTVSRAGVSRATRTLAATWVFGAALAVGLTGQQPGAAAGGAQDRPAAARPSAVQLFFSLLDADKNASLTRDEVKSGLDAMYTQWDGAKANTVGLPQVFGGLSAAMPGAGAASPRVQSQTPRPSDVQAMMAALPERAPVQPKQPRRVLVLGRAAGFVHSSIPLAARTIEEMGRKTGAWTTTITYDAADINDANLKQFDAIFLASTTGAFLDDPNDPAATAARRQALLAFVRGGKGLAGIHAATDSYHENARARTSGGGPGAINWDVLGLVFEIMSGDANADGQLTRAELASFADAWYDRLDSSKGGRIPQAEFPKRHAALPPPVVPVINRQGPATDRTPDGEVGTWPEFNTMIGAFFKFHWDDGQTITVRLDDPQHPLNAPFKGQGYVIVDETYTFSRNTYSRENLRVLTSVDYGKMSAEDKAKEQHPREDGDYALSWIRREGKGRVFYEAHGHHERVYANGPLLAHVLAGMQYVLGDLAADDTPSARVKR